MISLGYATITCPGIACGKYTTFFYQFQSHSYQMTLFHLAIPPVILRGEAKEN